MKKILTLTLVSLALLLSIYSFAEARTNVRSYFKSNGTYVAPHYRSKPNSTRFDNWSTRGNYNPYTGKRGYMSPFKSYRFR